MGLVVLIAKITPQSKTPKLSGLKQCLFSRSRAAGRLHLGWAGLAWTPGSGLWLQMGFESAPRAYHPPWGLWSPLHGVLLGPRLKGQGPLRHVSYSDGPEPKRTLPTTGAGFEPLATRCWYFPGVASLTSGLTAVPRGTYSRSCLVTGKSEASDKRP